MESKGRNMCTFTPLSKEDPKHHWL